MGQLAKNLLSVLEHISNEDLNGRMIVQSWKDQIITEDEANQIGRQLGVFWQTWIK